MASATPQRATDVTSLNLLPWCSALFLVLYAVGVINNLIPLQLTSPQWQVRFCEALINQSPLLLMGLSVAVLGQRVLQESVALRRILSWATRAALPLTLGFALLIPLQGMASLQLLQNANSTTNAVIKESDRRLTSLTTAIKQTGSSAALGTLLDTLPPGVPPLEQLGPDLASQQRQLIALLQQLRGRTVLSLQVNRQRQQTLLLRNGLRLSLLAALLALVFQQLRPKRSGLAWPRLRWPQWSRKRRPSQAMAAELARYCNDERSGRG
jgi:hypothetical protein